MFQFEDRQRPIHHVHSGQSEYLSTHEVLDRQSTFEYNCNSQNASSHVLPVQQGEIVFKAKELSLCHVGGVGGCTKNGLLSLQAADVQLHHCGK